MDRQIFILYYIGIITSNSEKNQHIWVNKSSLVVVVVASVLAKTKKIKTPAAKAPTVL